MDASGLPQGLPWHPLRQTVAWIRRPQAVVDRCLRDYGDVFTLRVFGGAIVMHTSPELIRELLSKPPEVLAAGKANRMLAPIVGSASLLLLDGDEHLRMRRLLLPPLHGDRMRSYEHTMREVAEQSIARWPLEEPFQSWPRMQAITLDIIVRVVFGIQDAQRAAPVRTAVTELLRVGTSRRLLLKVGLRAALTGTRPGEGDAQLTQVTRARDHLGRLLDREIEDRRREGADDQADVLSLLLVARDEQGEPLATSLIRDQLITLLVAGHETTATSLAWAVERVAREPALQEQLAADALDGRVALIDATVKETLRARPALPIFVREVQQTVELGGRTYAPGTLLAGGTLALHRRPDLYPDPDQFRPERFLGEDAPGTYEWTPFGGGVRRCIGASFALLEMRVVLAALLAERRLEPVEPEPEQIRRRAIVLAPSRGGLVRAPRRRAARNPAADPTQHSGVR